jgi:hypothetical protein
MTAADAEKRYRQAVIAAAAKDGPDVLPPADLLVLASRNGRQFLADVGRHRARRQTTERWEKNAEEARRLAALVAERDKVAAEVAAAAREARRECEAKIAAAQKRLEPYKLVDQQQLAASSACISAKADLERSADPAIDREIDALEDRERALRFAYEDLRYELGERGSRGLVPGAAAGARGRADLRRGPPRGDRSRQGAGARQRAGIHPRREPDSGTARIQARLAAGATQHAGDVRCQVGDERKPAGQPVPNSEQREAHADSAIAGAFDRLSRLVADVAGGDVTAAEAEARVRGVAEDMRHLFAAVASAERRQSNALADLRRRHREILDLAGMLSEQVRQKDRKLDELWARVTECERAAGDQAAGRAGRPPR